MKLRGWVDVWVSQVWVNCPKCFFTVSLNLLLLFKMRYIFLCQSKTHFYIHKSLFGFWVKESLQFVSSPWCPGQPSHLPGDHQERAHEDDHQHLPLQPGPCRPWHPCPAVYIHFLSKNSYLQQIIFINFFIVDKNKQFFFL